jgi:hypothetical protein
LSAIAAISSTSAPPRELALRRRQRLWRDQSLCAQFSLNLRTDLHGTAIRVTDIEPGLVGGTEFSNVRFKGDDAKAKNLRKHQRPDAGRCDRSGLVGGDAAKTRQHQYLEMMPVSQSFAGLSVHRWLISAPACGPGMGTASIKWYGRWVNLLKSNSMAAESQLNPTQPVNQQIYRIFRRDIVHCLIPPGTPLSEKEVSCVLTFHVSRCAKPLSSWRKTVLFRSAPARQLCE